MSYDLYFWSYEDETVHPPGKRDEFVSHCDALLKGSPPSDISSLPTDLIKKRVSDTLSEAGWNNDGPFWDKEGATIEFYPYDRYVSFSLRHKWTGDHANLLIEIMKAFNCPLYDPQVGERFQP